VTRAADEAARPARTSCSSSPTRTTGQELRRLGFDVIGRYVKLLRRAE
jgi:hypothetical protein